MVDDTVSGNMPLGQLIRDLRQSQGYSHDQLAGRLREFAGHRTYRQRASPR
jgi:hypothetical protein